MKYSLIIEYAAHDQAYSHIIEAAIGKRRVSTTDLNKVSFDFYQLLALKKAIERARGLKKGSVRIRVLEHDSENIREWSRQDFHEKIYGK